MKKTYIAPNIEEIKLNNAHTLLAGSGGVEETTDGFKVGTFNDGFVEGTDTEL